MTLHHILSISCSFDISVTFLTMITPPCCVGWAQWAPHWETWAQTGGESARCPPEAHRDLLLGMLVSGLLLYLKVYHFVGYLDQTTYTRVLQKLCGLKDKHFGAKNKMEIHVLFS